MLTGHHGVLDEINYFYEGEYDTLASLLPDLVLLPREEIKKVFEEEEDIEELSIVKDVTSFGGIEEIKVEKTVKSIKYLIGVSSSCLLRDINRMLDETDLNKNRN